MEDNRPEKNKIQARFFYISTLNDSLDLEYLLANQGADYLWFADDIDHSRKRRYSTVWGIYSRYSSTETDPEIHLEDLLKQFKEKKIHQHHKTILESGYKPYFHLTLYDHLYYPGVSISPNIFKEISKLSAGLRIKIYHLYHEEIFYTTSLHINRWLDDTDKLYAYIIEFDDKNEKFLAGSINEPTSIPNLTEAISATLDQSLEIDKTKQRTLKAVGYFRKERPKEIIDLSPKHIHKLAQYRLELDLDLYYSFGEPLLPGLNDE